MKYNHNMRQACTGSQNMTGIDQRHRRYAST